MLYQKLIFENNNPPRIGGLKEKKSNNKWREKIISYLNQVPIDQ
jgi:hypothetical protein